ncbi:hypothetical protein S245_038886 [Arachis hypogaea]
MTRGKQVRVLLFGSAPMTDPRHEGMQGWDVQPRTVRRGCFQRPGIGVEVGRYRRRWVMQFSSELRQVAGAGGSERVRGRLSSDSVGFWGVWVGVGERVIDGHNN